MRAAFNGSIDLTQKSCASQQRLMRLTHLLFILLAVALSGACALRDAHARAAPVRAEAEFVSFDMPHGSCRLTVESDGSARLQFGAAVRYVNIRRGSFNLPELRAALRKVVQPADAWMAVPQPRGGVVFSDDGVVLPFTDEGFAQRLFQQAWDTRATTTIEFEQRYEREIFRLCKLR